jgi:uncharacterized protein YkwD
MKSSLVLSAFVAALILATPFAAHAALDDSINALRKRGCDGKPGVSRALRASRGLDAVAKEWSKGGRLKEAFARTDYRMVNSASMRVAGAADERALLAVLAANYCASIVDPTLTEIGVHRRGDGVWIVLAAPFSAPAAKDSSQVSREVLQLVNQARASPRRCGRKAFKTAPPLTLSPTLERAARAHAADMARHSLFEHRGSDGALPADRVTRAGYRWRTVAENIAAGARDAQTVVQGWLESPGHCANIMAPQYSEMGVAYAVDPKSDAGVYWAQVFASPR